MVVEDYIDIIEDLNKAKQSVPLMPYSLEEKIAFAEGWRMAMDKAKKIVTAVDNES